jgi:hyaluronan synthase
MAPIALGTFGAVGPTSLAMNRMFTRPLIKQTVGRWTTGADPHVPPAETAASEQPLPTVALRASAATPAQSAAQPSRQGVVARPGAEIAPMLKVLSERHGVSDEQLATLLDWTPEQVAEYRATASLPAPDTTAGELNGSGDAPAEPAAPAVQKGNLTDRALRAVSAGYLVVLLGAILYYKSAFLQMLAVSPLLSAYGIVVVGFICSRFVLSAFYRPGKDHRLEPRVAVVMPGFNEEAAIATSLRSLLELNYPGEKLEIVAVNDGSTDNTLGEMTKVAATAGGRVRVINFTHNRGKRAAMAAGIRATDAEVIAFVDSDSVLDPDAMRIIVQGFHNPKVGAICGHAHVFNVRQNWMTKMQAVRYFVAFSVAKAAESVFGCVTCCSGCFSAYRREAIMPKLDWWENQKFLGRDSTFGDDRSLTNCVLRDWKVKYEARAISHTIVPATFRQFMRQQLRWKRSWTRESLIVSRFMWRKHPVAALSVYVGILLPLVAPIIAVHSILFMPAAGAGAPLLYLMGVYVMSLCYGLYYSARKPRYDALWLYGILFCFFYLAFLLWQTYYAMATTRSASWGTRPSTAGMATPAAAGLTTQPEFAQATS